MLVKQLTFIVITLSRTLFIPNHFNHFQYLVPASTNCLQIDRGLVEALNIKISNSVILPENTWFDSICKFVYEKLKVNIILFAETYDITA